MSGRLVEGVWDCVYCDTKKIRGSIQKCPNCGRQRDKNITFYLDDPTNYVDDDVAKTMNRNPDWLCSFCDGLNSDNNSICYNCGASREDSEDNYFTKKEKIETRRMEKQKSIQENYVPETEKETFDNLKDKLSNINIPQHKKKWYKSKKFLISISSVLLATILTVVSLMIFLPKTKDVTVSSLSWERIVDIQEYKTVEENDWFVPEGGRLRDTKQEIHHYNQVFDHNETKTRTVTEQVLDHYETVVTGHRDLGNGMFEEITTQQPVYRTETRTETYEEPVYRNEPVYATKYYYEIERWVHKDYKTTSGKDKNPYWYTYDKPENEKIVQFDETYKICVVFDDGKKKCLKVNFNDWKKISIDQKIKIKVYITGKAELIK